MKRDAVTLERKMNDLLQRCRERGMNMTPQRLAIYRALLEAEDHPSPDVLFQRVRPRMPSLSLATIYKALDALTDIGLVQEVPVSSGIKRYDANLEKHHHLICTHCKKVVDVVDPQLDAVAPPKRLLGFVAHTVSVQVLGLCADCAKAKR